MTTYIKQNGSSIEYNTGSGYTVIPSWPFTLTTNTFFESNLTINNSTGGTTGYFIVGATGITIDGQYNVVTIDGVGGYPGLIQNGTADTSNWPIVYTNGYSNNVINNIGVVAINGTTLKLEGGWIAQLGYGNNTTGCFINKCYSTGVITQYSGGIVGANSLVTVQYCYSTGNCNGTDAGGIFGNATIPGCVCNNSYSIGTFTTTRAGGLYGSNAGRGIFNQGFVYATNCYVLSTSISSHNQSLITIANCYIANGNWSDNAALAALEISTRPTSGNFGSVWVDYALGSNTPYRLAVFNRNPYNVDGSTGIRNYTISSLPSSLPRAYTTFGQAATNEYTIIGINNAQPASAYINMDNSGYDGDTGTINFIEGLSYTTYTINVMYEDTATGLYSFGTIFVENLYTACFEETTPILMANGEMKCIKDIQRGEHVVTNIETGDCAPVARNLKALMFSNFVKIPKGLIGNTDEIICTENHPIWINNNQNRVYPKNIRGVEREYNATYKVCNLQLEEESTFYVHGLRVDSLSPYHAKTPLSKELFFNPEKYMDNYIVKNEDDERRNKPKLVKHYMPLKNKILYF